MKRIVSIIFAIAASGNAAAQDYFAGASIIAPTNARLNTAGSSFDSINDPLRFKLYGGVHLSPHLALEGGLAHFGKDRFAVPGQEVTLGADALYGAVRGTLPVGDDFEVFGRAGLSALRSRARNLGAASGNKIDYSLLVGLGVGYRITDTVTLTLEAEHFGRTEKNDGKYGWGGYSAGLNVRF